jgi:hypothetical protein
VVKDFGADVDLVESPAIHGGAIFIFCSNKKSQEVIDCPGLPAYNCPLPYEVNWY